MPRPWPGRWSTGPLLHKVAGGRQRPPCDVTSVSCTEPSTRSELPGASVGDDAPVTVAAGTFACEWQPVSVDRHTVQTTLKRESGDANREQAERAPIALRHLLRCGVRV